MSQRESKWMVKSLKKFKSQQLYNNLKQKYKEKINEYINDIENSLWLVRKFLLNNNDPREKFKLFMKQTEMLKVVFYRGRFLKKWIEELNLKVLLEHDKMKEILNSKSCIYNFVSTLSTIFTSRPLPDTMHRIFDFVIDPNVVKHLRWRKAVNCVVRTFVLAMTNLQFNGSRSGELQ